MRTLLLGLLLSLGLYAQTTPPDCQFTVSFSSATAQSPAISNKATSTGGTPCIYWVYTYWTNGASGVSIKMEGTNDNAGVPGVSFTALTAAAGTTNPQTGTNEGGAILCCDSYPWVRINPTTFTGTSQSMIVRVYGWRSNQGTSSGGGGVGSNVNVAQWGGTAVVNGGVAGSPGIGGLAADGGVAAGNPVLIAGHDSAGTPLSHTIQTDSSGSIVPAGTPVPFADGSSNTVNAPAYGVAGVSVSGTNRSYQFIYNGSTWDRSYACTNQAAFNLSGTGDTQIIALSGSTVIRICHISFTTITPDDVKLTQGTGSNCGSGTADLTGLYKQVMGLALDFGAVSSLRASAGNAVCLNQSVAQALGGVVIYARY